MKVTDHIKDAAGTLVSFEVLPPLKGKGIDALYRHLDPLMAFNPAYINVTYHRSEHVFKKRADGSFEKVVVRKRPGTEAICAAIMNKYNVDTVLTLSYLGIDNVLVLRGDAAKNESAFEPEPGGHKFASDLLKQVTNLNAGVYLEDELKGTHKTGFCIGVAGYPEKHFEAPNMDSDLNYLKKKVDAGADYIVTQMFYDNAKFHAFVKACREAGIQVPIIPGMKPITSKKQLTVLPKTFHIDLPTELSNEVLRCKTDEEVEKVGEQWLLQQSRELKEAGVPVLHYYTLGKPHVVANVVRQL